MRIEFLNTPALIEAQYARIAPVFQRVPGITEFDDKDLALLVKSGKIQVGYAEVDGDIKMVMAFEFIHYPKMMVVNIIALAGEGLEELAEGYFQAFKAWCAAAGADAIDALCSDVMARMLRRLGMAKIHNHVRIDL